jgi:hypothetical protein
LHPQNPDPLKALSFFPFSFGLILLLRMLKQKTPPGTRVALQLLFSKFYSLRSFFR